MFATTSVRSASTWSLHTGRRRTVSQMYKALVAKRVIQYDPDQWAMSEACTPLLNNICESCVTETSFAARDNSAQGMASHWSAHVADMPKSSTNMRNDFFGSCVSGSITCLRFTKTAYRWCADVLQSHKRLNKAVTVPYFSSWCAQKKKTQHHDESFHVGSDELTAGNAHVRAEMIAQDKVRRGLYLYGDVGTGKTMILDLFNMCDMPCSARRAHLHSFMTELTDRLVRAERTLSQQRVPNIMLPSRASRANPLYCSGDATHVPKQDRWARWLLTARSVDPTLVSPMDVVVQEILAESPVLCFDEFQTFDVAHAALLSAFFTRALRLGLFLLSTSNRSPEDLCLASPSLTSFVPVLRQHCHVLRCTSTRDYRRQLDSSSVGALVVEHEQESDSAVPDRCSSFTPSCHQFVFLHPSSMATVLTLMGRVERGMRLPDGQPRGTVHEDGTVKDEHGAGFATWAELVSCEVQIPLRYEWIATTLRHHGRCMHVPRCCGGVALFDFCDLCGDRQRLASSDFQLLARNFHTIVMVNVPRMSSINLNAAHQFVVLVDELYQHNVKLLMTLQVPWYEIMDRSVAPLTNAGQGEAYRTTRARCEEKSANAQNDAYYSEGNDERGGFASKPSKFRNDEEIVSFRRIHSRLCEMGSRAYLLRDHTCFVTTDYSFAALVNEDKSNTVPSSYLPVAGGYTPGRSVCS